MLLPPTQWKSTGCYILYFCFLSWCLCLVLLVLSLVSAFTYFLEDNKAGTVVIPLCDWSLALKAMWLHHQLFCKTLRLGNDAASHLSYKPPLPAFVWQLFHALSFWFICCFPSTSSQQSAVPPRRLTGVYGRWLPPCAALGRTRQQWAKEHLHHYDPLLTRPAVSPRLEKTYARI